MPDPNVGTAAEEIAHPRPVRPHLVILGAGASRAAFPNGEHSGRRLPLMVDFSEIVPVAPILQKSGIDYQGKNFEEVYTWLSEKAEYRAVQTELEEVIFDYFSELRLPETPTIYDLLLLCLRQKDVIATFNWDPFLIQAWQRSSKLTKSLPSLLFLHGSVAHGYCDRDSYQGLRGQLCERCGRPLQSDKLLFPVTTKDYSSDATIRKAWEVTREALKNALMVTTFGYSAPASDRDALSIMSEAWGEPAKRQFELFEMIDVKQRGAVLASWKAFIFSGHYRVSTSFSESFLAIHPRRSIEAFRNQYIDAKFLEGNPMIEAKTLDELHDWFRPLIEAEQHEGQPPSRISKGSLCDDPGIAPILLATHGHFQSAGRCRSRRIHSLVNGY